MMILFLRLKWLLRRHLPKKYIEFRVKKRAEGLDRMLHCALWVSSEIERGNEEILNLPMVQRWINFSDHHESNWSNGKKFLLGSYAIMTTFDFKGCSANDWFVAVSNLVSHGLLEVKPLHGVDEMNAFVKETFL